MLSLITIPDPRLRERSKEIDRSFLESSDIQEFIRDMISTMYADDGIGIAAPQVGKNIRVCIIGKDADKGLPSDLVLVNPVWEKISRKTNLDTEGCLSVPKKFGTVKRWNDISVSALDAGGNPIRFDAHEFFARVIQHEVDHLNGILFIDKATDVYDSTEKITEL